MDWWKKKVKRKKGKISSSVPEELIQVDPNELRFPFLPNATMSALFSIKLVNVTDNHVFIPMVLENNLAECKTSPRGGILPPRSSQEFLIIRVAKKSVAQSIRCSDEYILYSTSVSESFSSSEYGSDLNKFYEKQGGQIWHKTYLSVVLYPANQQESQDGIPHTEELDHHLPD